MTFLIINEILILIYDKLFKIISCTNYYSIKYYYKNSHNMNTLFNNRL